MNLNKIRLFFILLSLLFLLVFIYLKVSPLGTWACNSNFSSQNHLFLGTGCFSKPSPNDRFLKEKNIKMIGDPLYFSLYSPRNFDKLNLEIKFKANLDENNPVIEAGLLVNKDLFHYQLKPVYNFWLEDYKSDWQKISQDDDIEKLLIDNCQEIPLNFCLAQYNLDKNERNYLPRFSTDKETKNIKHDLALRGHHSFYIYLKDDSDLNLKLQAKDLNLNQDKSPITIDVYSYNDLIYSEIFPDNRLEEKGSRETSDYFDLEVFLSSLPEGFYRLDLKANDDIVFNNLSIESSILSWRRRLWFYHEIDREINLLTDSKVLQVKVQNPSAFQDLIFANENLKLKELYKQYEIMNKDNNDDLYYNISFKGGGLLLEGPGVFAFSEDKLFNPNYSRLDRFYQKQAKFVFDNYEEVKRLDDGYYLANLNFDLAGVYREDNKYNLIISVPGLRVEDKRENFVEIKNIKAIFSGKTLFEKINEF